MTWAELSEPLGEWLNYGYALGALAVLTILFLLLRRAQPKKVVAYVTESGRVMVSRSAIVELVQTSCSQLEEVSKPSVKIKVKGKTTHCQVHIKLTAGGRLRDIEQTLQSHLRTALTENLGIENLGKIDIIATGFKSGKISSRTKPVKATGTPALAWEPEADPEVGELEPVENDHAPESEKETDRPEPKRL